MNIYVFQWISDLGGADTRLKDLLKLLGKNKKYNVCCIPNDDIRFLEKKNIEFLHENNIDYTSWKCLPKKAEGIALAFCNFRLFSEDWRIKKIKDMGLKFVWSNDMTWHSGEELESVEKKMVDAYLYTSEFHKSKLSSKSIRKNTKEFIIPNYFDPDSYNFFERQKKETFTIGKHSRPDLLKFSDDFPLFYTNLNLKNPKYKVMGIDRVFKNRFKWFDFNEKWELLEANQEPTSNFLNSLDAYVYNSHESFVENQSRAIIEALLSGLPVIAPNKYNFPNQILNKETGFLWNTKEELEYYARELEQNFLLRKEMGKKASEITKEKWCDASKQLSILENIFDKVI